MATNKCPGCGLVNRMDAEACKRCKSPLIQTKETLEAPSTVSSNEQGPH